MSFPLPPPTESFPQNQGSHFICLLSLALTTVQRVWAANKYLLSECITGSVPSDGSPGLATIFGHTAWVQTSPWVPEGQKEEKSTRRYQCRRPQTPRSELGVGPQQERGDSTGNGVGGSWKQGRGRPKMGHFARNIISS